MYGNETKSVGLGLVWVGWVPIAIAAPSVLLSCRSVPISSRLRPSQNNTSQQYTYDDFKVKVKVKVRVKAREKNNNSNQSF